MTWLFVLAVERQIDIRELAPFWPMTLAMVAGSLIAGSTPIGGGVVGFPVAVLVLDFSPDEGRDFTVLIQSVGMNAAAAMLMMQRAHLLDFHMVVTYVLYGIPGVMLGLAVETDPFWTTLTFQILVVEFACVLAYLECIEASDPSAPRPAGALTDAPAAAGGGGALLDVLMVASAILGGFFTANVGSGSDMCLYAFGVLIWNTCAPHRALTTNELTANSVVVMGLLSLVAALCRALTGQIATRVYLCWAASTWLVAFGAPVGSLLLTPRRQAQLRRAFYVLAVLQFGGFALLRVGSNPLAWTAFAIASAAIAGGLTGHYCWRAARVAADEKLYL